MSRYIIRKIGLWTAGVIFACAVLLTLIFIWINLVKAPATQSVSLGITYSDRYAEALGLDPHETYTVLLDELGVRKVRLPVYWDRIETAPGEYDFSQLDWQLRASAARQAEVILVVGQRVPRWPECFIPSWVPSAPTERQAALSDFIRRVVERYKDHSEVKVWQVENEAFLDQRFGSCPLLDIDFLDKEISIVRGTDPTRPVLMTDSGEISWWYQPARRGDLFGTTLYRNLWHPRFGYLSYPFGPNFFLVKKWLIHTFAHQDHLIVVELQAEPWANGWIGATPLEEQFITMDEQKLVANIEYAKQLGVSEIYLWGVEWWYWLKVNQHYPTVWDTAKGLFQENMGTV
jgi:hypothetical protein